MISVEANLCPLLQDAIDFVLTMRTNYICNKHEIDKQCTRLSKLKMQYFKKVRFPCPWDREWYSIHEKCPQRMFKWSYDALYSGSKNLPPYVLAFMGEKKFHRSISHLKRQTDKYKSDFCEDSRDFIYENITVISFIFRYQFCNVLIFPSIIQNFYINFWEFKKPWKLLQILTVSQKVGLLQFGSFWRKSRRKFRN